MMYFLDFDRTLFDTDAFSLYLQQRSRNVEPGQESTTYTFAPGELSQFVFPDVPEFLRMLGNEATIVTHGDPVFQRSKVVSALGHLPRISALYVGDMPKGEFLAPRFKNYAQESLFVDDTLSELENVAKHCPEIHLYEMRRDGGAGDSRWSVIHSLTQLP